MTEQEPRTADVPKPTIIVVNVDTGVTSEIVLDAKEAEKIIKSMNEQPYDGGFSW